MEALLELGDAGFESREVGDSDQVGHQIERLKPSYRICGAE